jgi:hypothetical protein
MLLEGLLAYLAWTAGNYFVQRSRGFRLAKSLAGSKGIVNVGAGVDRSSSDPFRTDPAVKLNIDILDPLAVPGAWNLYRKIDLEKTPYNLDSKSFGCVFASHVLEHLQNWQAALTEFQRIANHVVIVLPNPLSISGHLVPEHRQHFNFEDIRKIQALPGVSVFS